ncbi:hypothetical protein HUE46_00595 [Flavobacterium columnare]|uniref:Uncharacterized protein n=1 Tax=Flavobacterium columnare TaxID=996 RepID=A0AAI8CFX7_9FLAO|nr:hypothetical protein [Flavobacterium columnare]AMO19213.1 hypothetical protein UN65_01550 [Flavobacterium columnare]ANO48163.1 hypothetical protein Pf1_02709 [Flavobacterium columnare]APT21271.1 hypothetical protein BU993_00655 [Flavobacterium columnare]AUX17145.1 hypothetical protein AQ623_01600 [Flavobacterium columnare]MBF6651504.1 hypothetical protein [Flavobacterium columnare]
MNSVNVLEIAAYTIPSIVTAGVAYYFFQAYFKDQQNMRYWLLQKENQKDSLPLKLQAYERMALFLERINPTKLLMRVAPMSEDKMLYAVFLLDHIEQELEHNITQQIYLTDNCWNVILTAKNTIAHNIQKTAKRDDIKDADNLRQTIMNQLANQESPTTVALAYLKKEIGQIL